MAYSRPGALRAKTLQKMEERGGIVRPVDPRNTSLRCPRCCFACRESRNYEDYDCIMCGWYHHADKNGASNIKLICLHGVMCGWYHHADKNGASNPTCVLRVYTNGNRSFDD